MSTEATPTPNFRLPGIIVFIGELPPVQDGNGWWSKLGMMKGYAKLSFHIAIWTPSPNDPLGEIYEVDPLQVPDGLPVRIRTLNLHEIIPHIAIVVDRYQPNHAQPEILRTIFSDHTQGFHPRIVADFADCATWVREQEGRDWRQGSEAFLLPSVSAAWRPEVLMQYDTVQLPKGRSSELVKKVLTASK